MCRPSGNRQGCFPGGRRTAFLERLNNGIMDKRDEDIMPILEVFTNEVKASIGRKTE